jgi:hypothetical protein
MLNWYFGPSASEEHGPKDSITQTFKGDKYYSLAREVIQNSLDVAVDKKKPVTVEFSLFTLKKAEFSSIFEIAGRYKKCSSYFNTDNTFKKFCDDAETILSNNSVTCLRISDYNTTGLEYKPDDTSCNFYAFMSAVGVTNKSAAGAGGSFGFGKGAYYAASPLRIIAVSSIYDSNKFIFQGKARLTTHKNDEGQRCDYTGLFGTESGKPLTDNSVLPDVLKRKERGTDISIIGFNSDNQQWKVSLIKSIINNFWLSIWEEHLVAIVDGKEINKNNLEQNILEFYTDNTADGSINEPENWNPYPYFKAVKYKNNPEFSKKFEEELPTLGKVSLVLLLKDNYPNRIMYVRSPKMVVFKNTSNRGVNYAGVFVCDNKKGNELLRQMENPQHNEWKKNNYLENEKPHPDAVKADKELKDFIKNSLDSLSGANAGKKQTILGLEKYLSIPEDLLEESETGIGDATGGIHLSSETSENETGAEKTYKEDEFIVKPLVVNKTVSGDIKGSIDPEGSLDVLTGNNKQNELDNPDPQPGKGSKSSKGTNSGNKLLKVPIPVLTRLIATKETDGTIVHLLKIKSPKDADAEVELFAGVDNDSEKDNLLEIKEASSDGSLLDAGANKINMTKLKAGWNELKIKFDSNQKYALKLRTYEI